MCIHCYGVVPEEKKIKSICDTVCAMRKDRRGKNYGVQEVPGTKSTLTVF